TEPDISFAERPTSAALILGSSRRVRPLPVWRVRTTRAATRALASAGVLLTAFLSSVAYGLVSTFTAGPVTNVATLQPDVGVIVDASAKTAPKLAREFRRHGIHVTFALSNATASSADKLIDYGDDTLPRLNDSGLFGWAKTKSELHKLERELGLREVQRRLGWGHHFLYTSSGPSILQVLLADGAGGTFVEGKLRISKAGQRPRTRTLKKGEIIEIKIKSPAATRREVIELAHELRRRHLDAVPLTPLIRHSPSHLV
ncbi:MAG: hypothetical protein ACRDL5_06380, partial [Solirubrobacteraceae bacterium]